MTINLHIMDRGNAFGSRRVELEAAANAAIEVLQNNTELSEVDITVQPTDWGTDQPHCSAVTTGPHGIQLTVETSRLHQYEIANSFFRTVVHELHHCLRWRYVSRWTVNEGLALEGLALRADTLASQDTTSHIVPPLAPQKEVAFVKVFGNTPLESHRDWLYASDDGTATKPSRIYSVGDYLMIRALDELGIDPFVAAKLPIADLMRAAMKNLP